MRSCESPEVLRGFLSDQLSEAKGKEVAEHVAECISCRALLGELSDDVEMREWVRESGVIEATSSNQPGLGSLIARLRAVPAYCSSGVDADCNVRGVPATLMPPPGEANDWKFDSQLRRLGRYDIIKCVGEGSFGTVYQAHDPKLERMVAIKVLRREWLGTQEQRDRFEREAQRAAQLHHPGIVAVHDIGQDGDQGYVVSDFVNGPSLAQQMQQGRLAHGDAAQIVAQVADALHHAHQQGLVHRDVKPGNILLDEQGRPHITDFGLAAWENELTNERGMRAGTPPYMSPEQVRGESHRIGPCSDVYSLGVLLYELLCGRLPFTAETFKELFVQIQYKEPWPPRTFDSNIPRELERICLKSLSKRISERHSTAHDLAEELRLAIASASTLLVQHSRASPSGTPIVHTEAGPTSNRESATATSIDRILTPQTRVVPKGLRSFDREDSDFFIELLPGPCDREGLPDSIRFWKSRVERQQAEGTFAVGLIYGPSGCGKTSLVKAGLSPRLADWVVPVYVEATRVDTEERLAFALRKACPSLDSSLTLVETITELRHGRALPAGKKVLIVLDQFEQWLHAHGRELESSSLVAALRQTDGAHVQCLLMIRDDFWAATNRLFQGLEIRMEEDENVRLVDLFDPQHARHVLELFGAAYGRLPTNPAKFSGEQRRFLEQAVGEMNEEGRIVPVRLSLFAHLMKDRPWTDSTLTRSGGMEGVAVQFLRETFTARTAVPEYRALEKPARAMLWRLLPEHGTDIKGQMRSRRELAEASGLDVQSRQFARLLEMLDGDLHVVTPTELAQTNPASDIQGGMDHGQDYYQLTHDYLVRLLREWLSEEQRRTWRGRAHLRLTELAVQWGRARDSRFLPSPSEFVPIFLGVPHGERNPQQRALMRAATRRYGIIASLIGIVTAVVAWAGWDISGRIQQARRLVEDTAEPAKLRDHMEHLPPVSGWAKRQLEALAMDESEGDLKRQHAALLLPVEPTREEFWRQPLVDREKADAARALLRQGRADQVWPVLWSMLKESEDPSLRTHLIHRMGRGGVDAEILMDQLDKQPDASIQQALILALGGYQATVATPDRVSKLLDLYRAHPDPGVHAALDWLLRRLRHGDALRRIAAELISQEPLGARDWYHNGNGHTLAVVRGPVEFLVGAPDQESDETDERRHTVRLSHSFAIATTETTRQQFAKFWDQYAGKHRHAMFEPTPSDEPVNFVTWYEAAAYCRWLSEKEGIPEEQMCYPPIGDILEFSTRGRPSESLTARNPSTRSGYRLPTEEEWEFSCRAGTTTSRYYGEDEAMLPNYAWSAKIPQPVGHLKPNRLGLFDVLGNVWEWCDEVYYSYPNPPTELAHLEEEVTRTGRRLLRGGSFQTPAPNVRSAYRNNYEPALHNDTMGFRIARTIRSRKQPDGQQ